MRFAKQALMRAEAQNGGLSAAARGGRAFDYAAKAALMHERTRRGLAPGKDTLRTQWFAELEHRVDLPPENGGDGVRRIRWLDMALRLPDSPHLVGLETKCFSSHKRPGERSARIDTDIQKLDECARLRKIDGGVSVIIGTGLAFEAFVELVERGGYRGSWTRYDEISTRARHRIYVAYVGVVPPRRLDKPCAQGTPPPRGQRGIPSGKVYREKPRQRRSRPSMFMYYK
jgi:hypothetical protein